MPPAAMNGFPCSLVGPLFSSMLFYCLSVSPSLLSSLVDLLWTLLCGGESLPDVSHLHRTCGGVVQGKEEA